MNLVWVLKRIGLVFAGIALIFTYDFGLNGAPVANADTYAQSCSFTAYGRTACNGYLTNTDFYQASDGGVPENDILVDPSNPAANAIPASVDSAATFITFYENYLAQGSPAKYEFNSLGAAVTIDIMLGANGAAVCNWYDGNSTCNWQAAIAYAQDPTHLADWESRVNYYAAQNLISWNVTAFEAAGVPDSGHVCTVNSAQCWLTPRQYPRASPGADGRDVAWSANNMPGIQQEIVFQNPDGTQFILDRLCSNEIGDTEGIQPTGYSMNLTANGTTPDVVPGQTGTIDVGLNNTGPNASNPGILQIQLPGSNVTPPCAGSCTDANQSALTYGTTSQGFTTSGSGVPGVNGANWYWNTAAFPDSTDSTGSLTFKVPAGAGGGTITFDIYYYPGNDSNQVLETTVTFTVDSFSYPSVQGLNGDVHAGGGLCGGGQSAGSVIGDANSQSGTQYVVSATGSISNFASNDASGVSNLDIGANGAYKDVCREDLLSAANTYFAAGTGYQVISGSWNIANLLSTYPGDDVFFSNGGNLQLSGNVTRKVTIVARAGGTIEINGNIQINAPATLAAQTPSLGLIAENGINIDDNVTRVDAYMFSDGDIDTCAQYAITPNPCTANLLVNGFLMANTIGFHRIGPNGGSATPISEQIVLNPQIYLNPPVFFDASVDGNILQGLGEAQPLY